MDSDYGWLRQMMMRGMSPTSGRTMPMLNQMLPVGGGANSMDAMMYGKVASPMMKVNPMAMYQQQQQQPQQQAPGPQAIDWTGGQQS